MIKVVYLNHYGVLGGAQRSMLELITSFPKEKVSPVVITPAGRVEDVLDRIGIEKHIVPFGVTKFDHTKLGYYRGWRWLILIREVLLIFPTLYSFMRYRRQFKACDVVHVNELTCLLSIIAVKRLFKKPLVVHARVLLNNDQAQWRTDMVSRILRKHADRIIAIDSTVAGRLPKGLNVAVIHNSFAVKSPIARGSEFEDHLKTIPKRRLNIGFLGAIHHNKGVFDLMKAAALCVDRQMDVSFIIAGNRNPVGGHKSRGFGIKLNRDAEQELFAMIDKNKLQNNVHLIGLSSNTEPLFRYIDVVCFPSHYGALGRPVFEAAFYSKPSIVALTGEVFSDTFISGHTGIRVDPHDPQAIFEAIKVYYDDPSSLVSMGSRALELANENFDPETNASKVLDVYESLIKNHHAHPRP